MNIYHGIHRLHRLLFNKSQIERKSWSKSRHGEDISGKGLRRNVQTNIYYTELIKEIKS